MGSSPVQRPPRERDPARSKATRDKTARAGAARSQAAHAGPSFADPETVEAVREATASALAWLERVGSTGGRALIDASVFAAGWLWPRLRDGAVALALGCVHVLGVIARWMWTQRSGIARVGHRGLWWAALAILVLVGRALLSADGDPELIGLAMTYLVAGLSMSVLVLLGAPETRMRVAAFALASGHGSLAALTWVAVV